MSADNPVHFRDLIPSILENCKSSEEFLQYVDSEGKHLNLWLVIEFLKQAGLEQILNTLMDTKGWRTLAERDLQGFRNRRSKLLRQVGSYIDTFGVCSKKPAHRPAKNAERDAKIYDLKRQHPVWTFAEIACHIGIEDGAAERAYKRYRERQSLELRRALTILADFEEAIGEAHTRYVGSLGPPAQ